MVHIFGEMELRENQTISKFIISLPIIIIIIIIIIIVNVVRLVRRRPQNNYHCRCLGQKIVTTFNFGQTNLRYLNKNIVLHTSGYRYMINQCASAEKIIGKLAKYQKTSFVILTEPSSVGSGCGIA
jgi:hypothetical protein